MWLDLILCYLIKGITGTRSLKHMPTLSTPGKGRQLKNDYAVFGEV